MTTTQVESMESEMEPPVDDHGRPSGTGPVTWEITGGGLAAVRRVRSLVVAELRREVAEDADLDAAAVVVSELLTNAVIHASGPVSVELAWVAGRAWLRVTDQGPCFELPERPELTDRFDGGAAVDGTGGRGLLLVAGFADDLAVRRSRTGGCVVSVALRLARDTTGGTHLAADRCDS